MNAAPTFLALDYGARLAGTTAVCFEKSGSLHIFQSAKKQDADAWLRQIIAERKPEAVFMDAPLCLPGVYRGNGDNFHYRKCDQLLNAMSPMFLGGLTARAMQLRGAFPAIPFYEIYPAHLVRTLLPGNGFYKNDIGLFLEKLTELMPFPFENLPENWHQVDSALAWLTGWRHGQGLANAFGEEAEGLIWV